LKAAKSKNKTETILPFEKRLVELEQKLRETVSEEERRGIEAAIETEQASVYPNLTAWERVLLARHNDRPRMLDYVSRIFDDFIELHGDRVRGDDPAVVGGLAQDPRRRRPAKRRVDRRTR
jgi:acetyl-CoA carboxylase carboxyl transferase subunit alpha